MNDLAADQAVQQMQAALDRVVERPYVDLPANRQAIEKAEGIVEAYLPGIAYRDMTPEQKKGLHALEETAHEVQMMTFLESVIAGDSEAARKRFFGRDYPALLAEYEREQGPYIPSPEDDAYDEARQREVDGLED